MADVVIIALIIAYCVFLYVRHREKKKDGKAGTCSGYCAGCSGCSGCSEGSCGGVPYSEIFKDQ